MNARPRRLLALGALLGTGAYWACGPGVGEGSFQTKRATFETTLTRHGPSRPDIPDTLDHLGPVLGDDLPGALTQVTYPTALGPMKAWLFQPAHLSAERSRALLMLHAGWSMSSVEEYAAMRAFTDAGFVIMWPTYRGEHDNPGYFEFFFGEVEDAAAAARWLAAHPAVDPERVYALGWSAGGGLAAMLSLWDDVPVRHTASSGGLYHMDQLRTRSGAGLPPFDTTNVAELEMRTLPGNFASMKRRHYAYIEIESSIWDRSITQANQARERGDTLIEVIMVPGDHYSAFPEAVRRYFELIELESR